MTKKTKQANRAHTFASVKEIALQFQTRTVFARADCGAYRWAGRNGVMEEICSHMTEAKRTITLESAMAVAAQYQSRIELSRGDPTVYVWVRANGVIDQVCAHMTARVRRHTIESVTAIAAGYQTRKEFQIGDAGAYQWARSKDVLDTVCAHMERQLRVVSAYQKHTPESVKEVALQYQTRGAFAANSSGAYQWARKNGILDEVCGHMPRMDKAA